MNYNGGEWLARCVQSVMEQSFTDFDCYIVDNGSTDGSLDSLKPLDDRFTLIEAGENLGFSAANNLAAKQSSAEWVALLNPDAFAHPDWLEHLHAATAYGPDVTMVGSTQFMVQNPSVFDGLGDEYHAFGIAWRAGFGHKVHPISDREAFAPCGAGALYHRATFLRLGGFDETFFCYHEDVDLGFRMRLDGGRCIQSAAAKIDHISSGISGRASDFSVYHGTRNRSWTFFKNTPKLFWPVLVPAHIAVTIATLYIAKFRSHRFAPTWRGVKDGYFKRPAPSHPPTVRKISYLRLLCSYAWDPRKVVGRAMVKTKTVTKI